MTRHKQHTLHAGVRSIVTCGLIAIGAQAHASLTTYSSSTSFLAALASSGTEYFTASSGGIALSRSAGAFDYTIGADSGMRAVQVNGTSYIVNNVGYEWVSLKPKSANAIGGQFFGSGLLNGSNAGSLTLRVFDSLGEDAIFTVTPTSLNDAFFGVSSTGTIQSLWVHADQGWTPSYLYLGSVSIGFTSAVPEPGAMALMLAGLAVGLPASRRFKRSR